MNDEEGKCEMIFKPVVLLVPGKSAPKQSERIILVTAFVTPVWSVLSILIVPAQPVLCLVPCLSACLHHSGGHLVDATHRRRKTFATMLAEIKCFSINKILSTCYALRVYEIILNDKLNEFV
ncbi:unnamed protein product [Leptidea sinapis]|uniref:Uncharacterized protein n=1 Tax=Leptidea sinapis TaxID=189913 RepID=A0A5E4QPP1_9NEOP|nr:unnamed protein product [Leptidea sinapis]